MNQLGNNTNAETVKILFGCVSRKCGEEELRRQFECFGPIRKFVFVKNEFGKSLRYGYVIMESVDDSLRAVAGLSGFHFHDRPIRVRLEHHH